MIRKKYGVEQCIDDEFDRYLIKKSILDFNLVYDPNACVAEVAPEPCPVIPIVPPTPIACESAANVTVEIVLAPIDCPAATNVTAAIVYQSSSQTTAPHPFP